MDTQLENTPQPAQVSAPPPVPPPPPGCAGSMQLPHWRSEPLPKHLAPTKEEIEKEQYAHLPDQLLNSLNKDKKPFTYTPEGVSGNEKGKLDLSSIRSPRMKKRLLANLADDEEESDQCERVTRSETPDVSSRLQAPNNTRRAMTPDVASLSSGQMYAPVLPSQDMLSHSPVLERKQLRELKDLKDQKNSTQNSKEFDSFIQKQMDEIEESLRNKIKSNAVQSRQQNGLEPEVQDLIDSYSNQRTVPMEVQTKSYEPEVNQTIAYSEPESTKATVEQTVPQFDNNRVENNNLNDSQKRYSAQESNGNSGINSSNSNTNNVRNDSKRENSFNDNNKNNDNNTSNPWDSDLLRHVLDGGLQEEIEKFEQISLETQQSFGANPKPMSTLRNDYYYEETPTFETFGRSLPDPTPVWSPPNHFQDSYSSRNQSASPFGSINRNEIRSPQPAPPRKYWSESPSPSPHPYSDYSSCSSTEPLYRGVNIPSNQSIRHRTGISPSEVPNYNSRPKPFYMSSLPPTPTATPPPQFMPHQQPIQRPKEHQFSTFGKHIPPQKINYQLINSGMDQMPQTRYIDKLGMYAQTQATDGWDSPNPGQMRSLDRNITFNERVITSPDRSGFKSPEPPKPILKKKLPPSERPPDPTPAKYMGANIPSRSFRVLQLMTGEDIDNQFIDNNRNGFETKVKPKSGYESCKQFNKTVSYSNYEDFGTDF